METKNHAQFSHSETQQAEVNSPSLEKTGLRQSRPRRNRSSNRTFSSHHERLSTSGQSGGYQKTHRKSALQV